MYFPSLRPAFDEDKEICETLDYLIEGNEVSKTGLAKEGWQRLSIGMDLGT